MVMSDESIEELALKIKAKTLGIILWFVVPAFSLLLLSIAGVYYGIKADVQDIRDNQEMRKVEVNGQFMLINSNIENVKSSVGDIKDQVKDLKNTVQSNDQNARNRKL